VPDSFYAELGDGRFASSPWTTGPWDPGSQHGGPPSALLARAVERHRARADMLVARVTVEIVRPVPVAQLVVDVELLRPGRSVEMLGATLSSDGTVVARATAWRVLRTEAHTVPDRHPQPPPLPDHGAFVLPAGWVDGYLSAVEWRDSRGGFLEPGPAAVWTRLRYPLVDGEEPTGLQRVLAVADSGNGVSGELDLRRWLFINPELTVHLHRAPEGEWVCLDAATAISRGGVGLATSVLSDLAGPVGVGAQALFVTSRD
jgi:Thioesterase-like superfamily